ncbi:MAG: Crp/Fnr family transcriptional regulator [Chloroflexi bacterium]|nr:Crp/Fnr family transcriptional regulator [Chloroflexota bacterium]
MVRARLQGLFGSETVSGTTAPTVPSLAAQERGRKLGYLSAIDIFRDMGLEDMAQLDKMTRMSTVRKGQIIFSPGDTDEMLFLLKRGRIQLYTLSPDGRKLVLSIVEPDTFFGQMSVLGQQMASTFAEAVEDSTVCIMTRDDIEALILEKPRVGLRLLEVLGARLLATETRLEEVAFKRVPARLAGLLLRLTEGATGTRTVELSHQEIAEILGVYRETVTNALDRLKATGALEIGRRRIALTDVGQLERLAEE